MLRQGGFNSHYLLTIKNFKILIDYSISKKFSPMDETAAPKAYAAAQMLIQVPMTLTTNPKP